ncbi:MAG: hypothetical protein WDN28_30930 [Chthoniobacter sp.]
MPEDFDIPTPQWPDEQKVVDAVTTRIRTMLNNKDGGVEVRHAVPANVIKGMADIATNIWKARTKMLDGASGEVRDEMKRVYRHIEGVLETLHEMGLEVKDHTGDAFDYGLPLKVITTQPTQGITRESVVETIKPTIYWQQQIIQMGEVVIATPASTETKV